ncbi:patatin-like phospholipase domain-containing protein 2 isoform X1 [Poecilia latipinna]|uniref:patatin-like phospholipase domain-containing protein 2 isoform X1 n=1 Tax=Poecilia latipinna TaxID=48699 RepID=UPI00072E08BA|nr:PREDICTED: patatin-like phospholipase domain-containing protein 2 isoform X1 [Poecilia latipinna]
MGDGGRMVDLSSEWNISFAGCGFRSIYYVGALSCILEQVPQLLHGAAMFGGASSGCLVAAALAVGIPIEQLCFSILNMAKEARKHTLGVFHPTFRMLQTVRHSLLEKLPQDAHLRASGRLCVSLTRLADGQNVLVSKFDTREELIQVLMCSCFFPIYCGFKPPSYHGVLYVDGALSNNMPLFEHRNTITMAPFSGESDICPREGTFNFFEVHYGNVSIQVNTGNVYRVCTSFLPPTLEKLAEICHNGYTDALRFLKERGEHSHFHPHSQQVFETFIFIAVCKVRPKYIASQEFLNLDLLSEKHVPRSLSLGKGWTTPPCRERGKERANAEEARLRKMLLSHKVTHSPPASIQEVLCEVCQHNRDPISRWSRFTHFFPIKLIIYMLTLPLRLVQLSLSLAKEQVLWLGPCRGRHKV